MSCTCESTGAPRCGCCSGIAQKTPAVIVNRPGLPSIPYRVGTYSSFLNTMLASLSSSSQPALAGLRTRSKGDFTVALVDAWAEALDVLTFYTERLANEAYVGTSVEARSIFELVRLVGYKPSPGVSASTVLVFTLASAPGAPATVPIAVGSRVQSVPGPGQLPQVFETSSSLTATLAVNAIPAATTQPWQLSGADTSTWIDGTANNVRVGDALLFLSAPGGKPSTSGPAAVVYVTAVQIQAATGNTFIAWDNPLPASFAVGSSEVCLYLFRAKAALFGVGAPRPGIFPSATVATIAGAPSGAITKDSDWAWAYTGNQTISLDNAYAGLNPAAVSPAGAANQLQWMVLTGPLYTSFFQVARASESNPGLYSISAKTTQLTVATGTVLRGNTSLSLDTLLSYFVKETRQTTALVQSQLLTFADPPLSQWAHSGDYPLTPGMLAPVSGGQMTLAGLQPLALNAPLGISGRRVRLAVTSATNPATAGFTPAGASAALAVSVNQAFLVDAFPPASDPATGNLLWSVLNVTGQPGTLSVPPGSFHLQPSVSTDPLTGEAVVLSGVNVQGATTDLTFNAALGRIYDAATVTVNANAVVATHGETVQEILGSGSAAHAALRLQLKQSPLTYTSAPTSTGVQSTLEVRVNNLLWTETPDFLTATPADRVFVTRPSATGGPLVQFGNGIQGSRTPTGQSNIRAQYRKGIGLAGMVAAGQLTQPIDRPQGVQSVSNPAAATGGADPATREDARQSASLPTLTLGRVVSLDDYQNFAIAFGGIGMAQASWTWFGNTRGIFLTVAGKDGGLLDPNDLVVQNLTLALQQFGLPYVPLTIAPFLPVKFGIAAKIKVDTPTFVASEVLDQLRQRLACAFAFGKLTPGQGVAAGRVIQLAQSIPGVLAVNLTGLNRSGEAASVSTILCASGPLPPQGAEVLTLDPASLGGIGVWS